MCTNLFKDSRIFNFIQEIDKDSEATASLRPCTHCNGKLDRSDYWRKPRGIPGEFEAAFSRRPSFCCRVDGCRRRATPLQLRFLSRRVYVSIVVLIAAAMTQGPSPKRLSVIEKELGVPARTVRRWLEFWLRIFPKSGSWCYQRGNLMPPIDETGLPYTLLVYLSRFHTDCHRAIATLLTIAIN